MRVRHANRLVQAVMALALVVTVIPLLRPWLPHRPLPTLHLPGDLPPVPGQVVVESRGPLAAGELESLGTQYGMTLRPLAPDVEPAAGAAGQLLSGTVTRGTVEGLLPRLRADRRFSLAEPMYRCRQPELLDTPGMRPLPVPVSGAARSRRAPDDPLYPKQWNFRMVDAERAWKHTAGKGVTVAVIDTGVAFENDDHCYLAKDFVGTHFAKGYDFIHRTEHPNDDEGHGTHVSGTIAETTNNGEGAAGLAHEATIMPIKVLDDWGSGTFADVAAGIYWAADHGAQIINMSLGAGYPDPVVQEACRYAGKKGVLIVCAAGNSGADVGYPAAFPECMAVSAVGPSGELTGYSSRGKEIALAAPGGDTALGTDPDGGILQNTVDYSTGIRHDDYFAYNGTSMASPHVAAAAALAISRGIRDPAEVRELLLRAATRKGPEEEYGAGVLNAGRTVALADAARRDSWLKLLFTLIAGLTGIGIGGIRRHIGWLNRFPFMPFGFVLGMLGPDLIFGWLGFGTPFNILLHSALIPLYLLWEADSRAVYRFVAALAAGTALHLAWDAGLGHLPFGGVLPVHALPWLWVNVVIGVGIALVAYRRSYTYP